MHYRLIPDETLAAFRTRHVFCNGEHVAAAHVRCHPVPLSRVVHRIGGAVEYGLQFELTKTSHRGNGWKGGKKRFRFVVSITSPQHHPGIRECLF